ncbi:MAG: ATP-binding protein [Clostridiales bacterium]|jgi:type IV secretory pathway VirB4 component|nr:ATP-binding protein [Clostridiales bacterium]
MTKKDAENQETVITNEAEVAEKLEKTEKPEKTAVKEAAEAVPEAVETVAEPEVKTEDISVEKPEEAPAEKPEIGAESVPAPEPEPEPEPVEESVSEPVAEVEKAEEAAPVEETPAESASAEEAKPAKKSIFDSIFGASGGKKGTSLSGEKPQKRASKTTQQTIPYEQLYSDGLVRLEDGYFSRTMQFQDINYQIARQDDQENIFLKYGEFLNYFDPSVNLQITINNTSVDKDKFENDVLIKYKHDGDVLDVYREEYNDMLRKQMAEGRNEITHEKYMTITIKAPTVDEARVQLARLESEAGANLKRLGSEVSSVGVKKKLEMLHTFFRGEKSMAAKIDYDKLKEQGMTTKDVIAPDSFSFKRNYFMIGEQYARALYISQLPSFLNDKFLSDMTDFPINMLLTLNIRSVDPGDALTVVRRKITGMETNKIDQQKKALKAGYDMSMISHDLKHSLEEAEELLDDLLNKNQKMFLVNILLVHKADSLEQLDRDTQTIKSQARKSLCSVGISNYQQEVALASTLPLGQNKMKITRTLTTESTAILIPFTSQELLQKNGMYYGLNAVSHNLIIFNRKTLKNPNGFILGTPGSGKSFSAKREMVNVLLNTDDDVLIIDPEREYAPLAENFGGELIHIAASSNNYINPMDMSDNYSDEENPVVLKSEFILSLCECLLGGSAGLTGMERTIIDRCVRNVYADYVQDFDQEKIPTMLDFQLMLESQPEVEARGVALALEIYTKGSLSIFANKSNINLNNRFIVFDIKDLGKQLKTMGMLIVLDAIWNRVTTNRAQGRRTWIYLDEIYLLFTNEYSANFLFELYKRARKWGGIPTGITQNVEDLLKSELARRMLSNSDFILMLNQATSDRVELAHLLNISNAQLAYVTNSNAGQGLLFSGDSIIPFVDKFPTNTKLYQMMTTKLDEIKHTADGKTVFITEEENNAK